MTRRTAVMLTWGRCAVPLVMFCAFAGWMLLSWRNDPYDPTLTGTRAYGHNSEGSLGIGLGFITAELVVYYLVTWPFLLRRPRFFFLLPLLSLVGLAVWIFISMVLSMHAGGIVMIHLLWLIALGVALFAETIISAVSGFAAKSSEDEPPAGA